MALVTQPGQRARLLETSTYLDFFGVRNVSRQIVTPPVLSADVDNYPIQDGSRYGLSATVPVAITGLAAAQAWHGLDLDLVNVGSQVITLANLSASSLAPNRILTGTGSDLAIAPLATVSLFYDQSIPGWRVSTAPGGGGGGVPVTDVQQFTANGTWTKPSGAKYVRGRLIGSGGGGGSGYRGAVDTIRGGGGGGSSGSVTLFERKAADLPATMAVTIPPGGAGGAAVAVDNTPGNPGLPAFTPPVFVTVIGGGITFRARCGCGAEGGKNGTSANGGATFFGVSTYDADSGPSRGSGSGADGPDTIESGESKIAGQGGGGGGKNATNFQISGGPGGNGATAEGGGPGGPQNNIFTSPPGAPGADGSDAVGNGPGGGGAGGGGAIPGDAPGGHGGKGGKYGGGGGGGEGVTNGNLSGAGGDGGPGFVEIVTYF